MRWRGSSDIGDGIVIPGTGSSRSSANSSQNVPNRGAGVSYFVDQTFLVILAATGVSQQCPAFAVPAGCTVRVRANNGASAGNTGIVFVQRFAGDVGKPLAPLDDIACPVDNTVRLWFKGNAGDGVVVNVITVGGASS